MRRETEDEELNENACGSDDGAFDGVLTPPSFTAATEDALVGLVWERSGACGVVSSGVVDMAASV